MTNANKIEKLTKERNTVGTIFRVSLLVTGIAAACGLPFTIPAYITGAALAQTVIKGVQIGIAKQK